MSRSSRQRHKYEKGSEVFEDQCNGGTAARTRPFSFDEIMLRRKNKKESGNVEDPPGGAVSIPGKGTSERASVREESNRHRHRHNDFVNNSGKRVSDESVKVISRRKEDDTSIKEDKAMKGEEKGSRDSERKAKATLNTNNSGDKAKCGKKDRWGSDKRKDELSSDDSRNDYGKRDSKVSASKDRHVDGNRGKSEMIGKRKGENDDDERIRDWNACKKHDSQKWHDSEFSERKEKKEALHSRHEDSRLKRRRSRSREHVKEKTRRSLSPSLEKKEKKEATKSRHEDARLKRRRSRSREHDKDKSRRSCSPSARGHKRTSDAREHGELTSHSSKDRSGRFSSDIDRKRVQINGSSNQSRRHGVSASRLGGYSPRKRRSDAAIKTPSPTSRSPEKKNAGWDLPPVKTESNYPGSILSNLESSNQTVLASEHELSSVVTVPSSTPKPILGVVSTTPSSNINSSIDSIQLTQATRPKRRLYVENLPSSASEEAVMEWLNSYLLSSGVNHIQGTNPCISCIVHKEKGQALMEFLTPEDASAALLFDGRTFSGSILKIRRPKDFAEVTAVYVGYIIIHVQDGEEADS